MRGGHWGIRSIDAACDGSLDYLDYQFQWIHQQLHPHIADIRAALDDNVGLVKAMYMIVPDFVENISCNLLDDKTVSLRLWLL